MVTLVALLMSATEATKAMTPAARRVRRYETSSAPPTQSDRLMGQMEAGGATLTNAFSNSIAAAREGTAGIAGVLGSGGFSGATSLYVWASLSSWQTPETLSLGINIPASLLHVMCNVSSSSDGWP